MRDYRTYKELYKQVGFLTILAATFTLAFKVTAWVIWANQYIDVALAAM